MRPDVRIRTFAAAASLACTLVLGGCALTREEVRKPELPLPEALPPVVGAMTPDLPDPWWAMFDDSTLDALLREAVARNTDVLAAAARVSEARALAQVANAGRLPSLDLEAGAARGRESTLAQPELAEDSATRNDYYVRGAVRYEVDLWGRYAHASTAARARLLASEYERDALRLSVSGETARAYFALSAAIQQYAQARETLANREESLRIERLRFEAGESEEITFRRVEGEVAATRAALHAYELDVERRENILGVLLGRSPAQLTNERILPLATDPATPVPLLPPGLPSAVLVRRPDIRAAEAQIVAAAGDVGVARAAMLPSIRLTGAYGSASLELGDLLTTPADAWTLGTSLLQPILQGGRLRADVARSRAVQEQTRADYSRTVQDAFREVLDGLQGQSSLRAVASARTAQVDALRRATDLAELRYGEGEIAYLELLDVRRGLFAAQVELINSRNDVLANTVDLALALGGGPATP